MECPLECVAIRPIAKNSKHPRVGIDEIRHIARFSRDVGRYAIHVLQSLEEDWRGTLGQLTATVCGALEMIAEGASIGTTIRNARTHYWCVPTCVVASSPSPSSYYSTRYA